MKIYISGAISSCPNTYKEAFENKKRELEAAGHIVVNPATLPIGLEGNKYMPICLAMIEAADTIYMFNDWQNSKGALLEKAYAEYQGKSVIYNTRRADG